MLEKDAIEHLLATGRAQNETRAGDDGEKFYIRPDGHSVSLAQFNAPTRVRQKVTLGNVESFCAYFERFSTDDSLIFGDVNDKSATFKAVIDYHGPEGPNYCDHVAVFATQPTPEWVAWLAADRKAMTQVVFAEWLEDNLHLFPANPSEGPSAADLLELVKSLHGHQTANFNTSLRLNTGAYSVKYEETIDVKGTMTSGAIDLPAFIYGGFPLFQGMPGYLIRARLKTRIENRKLVLFFETVALSKTVMDCLSIAVERIEEKTNRIVLLGDIGQK